ncbi:hypothetical protein M6B38_139360 [Iris pallida]|uniref:Uncharacterized protein n=1 Tax=Iris pallida TaxID=29817 RepID=A0AAX6FDL3_IRIPA|nr:hypothetical protein M6B38_139360 [Iris pallida]
MDARLEAVADGGGAAAPGEDGDRIWWSSGQARGAKVILRRGSTGHDGVKIKVKVRNKCVRVLWTQWVRTQFVYQCVLWQGHRQETGQCQEMNRCIVTCPCPRGRIGTQGMGGNGSGRIGHEKNVNVAAIEINEIWWTCRHGTQT